MLYDKLYLEPVQSRLGDWSTETPGRARQDAIPALTKDSPKPQLKRYVTILYSTRISPYCQRVRLILNQKNHPFQLVNINIWDKPSWFVGMTDLNTVPVMLDPEGSVFAESLMISEFVDNRFAGKRLLSLDHLEKAREKMLLTRIMNLIETPVRNLAVKVDAESAEQVLVALEKIEPYMKASYFFSEKPGFVDLMIYPWFDRLPAYLQMAHSSFAQVEKRTPKIAAWRTRMLQEPYVQQSAYPDELYVKSLEMRRSGAKNPDFNLDL